MNHSSSSRVGRALVVITLWLCASGAAAAQRSFETPEQAVQALKALIGESDVAKIEALFGEGSADMADSGDRVADQEDFQRVKQMIQEQVAFAELDQHTRVALFGNQQWPWPIPLVYRDGGWYFDTAAGREELLNRRIGHNELWTLGALSEVVEAQREYYAAGRDGHPPAFARRFRSSEGRQDGLWWPVAVGQPVSPLGDLIAESEAGSSEPQPFHGYFYRILQGQGSHAPGGEKNYVDANGLMTGGFAVLAWPAKYGNSGIMSFMVSQRGIVYQKDLGPDTARIAAAISRFDPDASWTPTPTSDLFDAMGDSQ